MSDGIVLSYGDARDAISKFRTEAGNVETAVGAVSTRLASLQGSWQGKAANDFQGLMDDYNRNAKAVNENLESLTTALERWVAGIEENESAAFS